MNRLKILSFAVIAALCTACDPEPDPDPKPEPEPEGTSIIGKWYHYSQTNAAASTLIFDDNLEYVLIEKEWDWDGNLVGDHQEEGTYVYVEDKALTLYPYNDEKESFYASMPNNNTLILTEIDGGVLYETKYTRQN